MKVFISHQKSDSDASEIIANRLRTVHGIDSYLDVIDPYVGGSVDLLADHIRDEMGKCTQLLAVVSLATISSQWVPWEIGVATEKRFPLATFLGAQATPPEFLRKWPYLRSMADVDNYALVSKTARDKLSRDRRYLAETVASAGVVRSFNLELKSKLGQL